MNKENFVIGLILFICFTISICYLFSHRKEVKVVEVSKKEMQAFNERQQSGCVISNTYWDVSDTTKGIRESGGLAFKSPDECKHEKFIIVFHQTKDEISSNLPEFTLRGYCVYCNMPLDINCKILSVKEKGKNNGL
jgi:hypothetical protein